MKIGLLALGRSTFDVDYAHEKYQAMIDQLALCGHTLLGSDTVLTDDETAINSIEEMAIADVDHVLILQVTFTDANVVLMAAKRFQCPISIWAVREPRSGGRLRLNAFCGFNLASHALGREGRRFGWLYADPDETDLLNLQALLNGQRISEVMNPENTLHQVSERGNAIAERLSKKRIARIGEHPPGFTTCSYNTQKVNELVGIKVDEYQLHDLFDKARSVKQCDVDAKINDVATQINGMDRLDRLQLENSLRLKLALDSIRHSGHIDGFALRCWPEVFTEFGGALCGPASLLADEKIPCACEADVFGSITQLLLTEITESAVFMVDLVDIDVADDSVVVWHCGQAPISMADGQGKPNATIHSNRKMPLLFEFSLKPGPVTFARLSQAHGNISMIIATGEMLARDKSFSGTSGVVRFDTHASTFLKSIVDSGLEHHVVLAYDDHVNDLVAVAASLKIPVLRL